MNNHSQQIMDSEQFIKRLTEFDITIDIEKLRRWSNQELISPYETHYQPRRKKKGRPPNKAEKEGSIIKKARLGRVSEWPEEALEQAVAVWAVRHYKKGIRITAEMVKVVKQAVSYVYSGGFPFYKIPPIFRSPDGVAKVSYQDIGMQFAPEAIWRPDGSDAISLFPGPEKEDRVKLLDNLVIKWIATIAKVRYTRTQELWARQAGNSSHYVWPLEQGATVVLEYHRRTPLEGGRYQDGKPVIASHTQLNRIIVGGQSDNGDRIFIFENGIDTRILLAANIGFHIPGSTPTQHTQQNQTSQRTSAMDLTAKSVYSPQKFGVAKLRPGYEYVMYNVTLTNVNARDRQVDALFFTLRDSYDNVYYVDSLVQCNYLSQPFPTNYRVTQPGDKVTGRIVFEIPQNATPVALNYEDHLVAYDYKVNNVSVRL
jgi:hypothetical protein